MPGTPDKGAAMFKHLIAAAALCLPLAALQAQHSLVLEKLTEWDSAAPAPPAELIAMEVRKAAQKVYPTSESCTNSQVTVERVAPATSDRFVFASIIQQRLRNAWTITVQLPGCDAAPVRFMIMQDGAGTLNTIRVNRGRSHAWDSLIGDTLPLAQIAAASALKRKGIECPVTAQAKLGVTRIANEDRSLGKDVFGVRYAGSWSEVWPLDLCNRTVDVTINFTADGDGGAYTNIPGERVTIVAR